jgi:hypothetical protein
MLNTNNEHQKVMHATNYTLVIGTDSHWMEMLSRASHVDGFLLYTGVQRAQTWSENHYPLVI